MQFTPYSQQQSNSQDDINYHQGFVSQAVQSYPNNGMVSSDKQFMGMQRNFSNSVTIERSHMGLYNSLMDQRMTTSNAEVGINMDGNRNINTYCLTDLSNSGSGNSLTTNTVAKVSQAGTMPTTIIVTTMTTVTTAMVQCQQVQQVTYTSASTSGEPAVQPSQTEAKRKQPEDIEQDNDNKRRYVDSTNMAKDEKTLDRLFAELCDIKDLINNIDNKVESIQEENKTWKQRWECIESELGEVKTSVEMAHNLIADETQARVKLVEDIKKKFKDNAEDAANNLKIVKTQVS